MQDISSSLFVTNINASLNRGGWELQLRVFSDTDLIAAWQNLAVKWRGAFGSDFGSERLGFNGYVLPYRDRFDWAGAVSEIVAQTSDGFLRRGWCQGIGFVDTNTDPRDHYHQFDSVTGGGLRMRMGLLIRHILGYYDDIGQPPGTNPDWVAHTNMVYHPTQNPLGWIHLDNVDITQSARVNRYIVRETNNLWSRLREIARNEFYELLFDKTDTLWYQPHPMYLAVLPTPVMTFDENFCNTPPIITHRDDKIVRQVKLHAVTDDGDTMHSEYPTSPTHVYGNVVDISRIRCNEQASLDLWAQRRYLYENRSISVKWTAPGLCGLLFELLDRVQITYTGTSANGVAIDWTNKKFWIENITVTPGPEGGHTGTSTFDLEEEVL